MSEQQVYTYEEAFQASKDYFHGNELAASIVVGKYLLRDNEQRILEKTPDDMHRRIASELARIEATKFREPLSFDEIYGYLANFKYIIPQGSPMYGIGNKYQYVTLSNCYVVPPMVDSYGGIHRTDEYFSQICKRRGGIGVDISKIRPVGSATKNSSRTSTGIGPFMERLSNSIREVGQANRRGAAMITISIHHPEVSTFIRIKNDLTKVTGANISVRLTDEFLHAVLNDTEYEQRWPVESPSPEVRKMVRAREVWNMIIENAWAMAEPGLLFWDQIIRESPADCYKAFGYLTVGTNPCSELPLSAFDSCRLFLLNWLSFVHNAFTPQAYFDFDEFKRVAKIIQRLIDDVVDLELETIRRIIAKIDSDPEDTELKRVEKELWQKVEYYCQNGRRTGTGPTAIGDTVAAMGLGYGTDDSIEFIEKLYREMKLACYESSVEMAKELGPFPMWNPDLERHNPFLLRIRDEAPGLYEEMQRHGRRNIALLTTAPAGTSSNLAFVTEKLFGTSSGIEPVFRTFYVRRKKITHDDKHARVDFVDQNGDKWEEFTVYHPSLQRWMELTGNNNLADSPWYGHCAEDIDWKQRVKLQAAANRHVDHAISSTINLPNSATKEDVAMIYETAWKAGCKGITVYRDGCRTGVLVEKKEPEAKIAKTEAPKRPRSLACDIHHLTSKGKKYYVIVGMLGGQPYEVMCSSEDECEIYPRFTSGTLTKVRRGHYKLRLGKSEITIEDINVCQPDAEALLRMTSTALRHGADISFIVQQLEKTKGDLHSFGKVLARALKKYIKDGTAVKGEQCPTCESESLIRQEGCVSCQSCGWTKCQ